MTVHTASYKTCSDLVEPDWESGQIPLLLIILFCNEGYVDKRQKFNGEATEA